MKFSSFALVAFAALDGAEAYLTPHHTLGSSRIPQIRTFAVDMAAAATESTTDVSVPYDAAAELEYSEWLTKYNKSYDAARYEVFKSNYEAITVMNVSAKKKARDSGSDDAPSLLTLNEYADCTAEEYEAAMGGGSSASSSEATTGDILGDAVAAAESQSAASSALQDAADALAEEEEKLAAQLGLGSVEELELAIDEMEGISEDGTMVESDNLAREARVRSAYMEWCKEYKKATDESRFPQFYKNFLEMEEFSKESGKEMVLNEYADFTEAEYSELTLEKEEAEAAAAKAKADAEAAAKDAAEKEAAAKAEAAKAEADAKKKAEEEEKQKARVEAARLAAMTDDERRVEIEKEKSARQSAQAKELEKATQASEAEAIAAAVAAAEAEAVAAAKRRQVEEEAYELARAKAKEWEQKQARLAAERQPPVTKKQPKKPSSGLGLLGDLASKVSPPTKTEPAPKREAPSILQAFESPVKKQAPKKASPVDSLASLFSSSAPPKKATPMRSSPPLAPKPVSKPKTASSSRPTLNLASIFESKPSATAPKPKPVAKAPSPAPKKASSPRPTLNLGSLFESPKPSAKNNAPPLATPDLKLKPAPKIDTSDPVTDAFSAIFGASKKAPSPKSAPAPPAPATKQSAGGFFGTLSSPAPKKASSPAPTSTPAAKKPTAPSFSFFNKPETKKTPAPAPVTKKAPASPFSLFNKPEPKKSAPAPAPAQKKQASFSLFNSPTPSATKTSPKAKPAPSRPTLALFAPKPKDGAQPSPDKKAAPQRPTLAIFGNSSPSKSIPKKASVADNVPVLSKWTQNPDGSITGLVSNSKSFRNGTRITTSPVRKGATKGTTVKTGSGSQYRLN